MSIPESHSDIIKDEARAVLTTINQNSGILSAFCTIRKVEDDLFDLWYTFDEETQHYGYHKMYFYATASEFIDSDSDGSMIEGVIRFVQEETSTGDVTEEEQDTETNGGIPGYPVLSIWIAMILVSVFFYMKQPK